MSEQPLSTSQSLKLNEAKHDSPQINSHAMTLTPLGVVILKAAPRPPRQAITPLIAVDLVTP